MKRIAKRRSQLAALRSKREKVVLWHLLFGDRVLNGVILKERMPN